MDVSKIKISTDVLCLVAAIDEFKGAWRALQNIAPDRLSLLRKVATIESVGSSTRIEGAKLTDSEIERLLSGVGLTRFRSRDEEEVAGYAEAMNLVFESYADIPLDESHIKQLHQVLLKHSSKDARHRGEYKKLPNDVAAFDAEGRNVGVVFETATPFDTPRKMRELVAWFDQASRAGQHHVLILMSVFIVHFLAIHPFQDGNGRLSRILTTLCLLKAGYLYVILAFVLAGLLVSWWLKHSRYGAWLQAVRDNEESAAALGVDVFRVRSAGNSNLPGVLVLRGKGPG